jgi:hypothetical protein
MMQARSIVLSLVSAGVLFAGVLWYLHEPPAEAAPSAASATATAIASTPDVDPPAIAPVAPITAPSEPPKKNAAQADIAKRFHDADDLFAFATSIQDAAKAGDGAAQYYMYRAIRRCHSEYMLYFGRNDRERTLDQALIQAEAIPGFSPETARELYQQCRTFNTSNPKGLGEGAVWLDAAVKSRYPLALSAKAIEKNKPEFAMTAEAKAAQRAEVGELAREALRSKEPQVLFDLSLVASLSQLNKEGESADETAAVWIMAACARGLECGANSEVFRVLCRLDAACQPYETLVDLLRRQLAGRFDLLDARARELNDDIDHERFDKIGF